MTFEFNDFRIFTFRLNEWHQNFYFTITIFFRVGCVTSKLNDISVIICIVVSYIIVTIFTSIGLVLHNTKPCLCLFCISLSLLLPRCPSLGWCYITILRPWWRHGSNAGSGGKFYAGLKLFLETTSKSSKLSQNIFNINITITRIKIKLFLKQHQHYQNQNHLHRYVPLTRSMFITASY